jgi:hypothetical protein
VPRQGGVRLINPKPMVEQFLQLLKLTHLFEVVRRDSHG